MQYFPSMEGSFTSDAEPPPRPSYQVINSTSLVTHHLWVEALNASPDVLRVVRKGPAIKNEVDDAIDLCAEVYNLRDSIEEARAQCEQATDERQKKTLANKGMYSNKWRIEYANDRNHPQVCRTSGATSNSSSFKHIYGPLNLTLCDRTSRSRVL